MIDKEGLQKLSSYYFIVGMGAFFLTLNTGLYFYLTRYLKNKKILSYRINSVSAALQNRDFFIILASCILFYLLKIINLHLESFDVMESYNILVGVFLRLKPESASKMLSDWGHQPLYNLMLSIITKYVSPSHYYVALRVPSVLFSVLTSYLIFIFSFKIFKKRSVSFTSFFLVNTNYLLTYYSRRAEAYSLFVFLTALSYYYFWEVFIEGNEKKFLRYVIINIACFFCHYLAFVVIFSQGICLFILQSINRSKSDQYRPFVKNAISNLSANKVAILYYLKFIAILNFILIPFFPFISSSLLFNATVFSDPYLNSFYLSPVYFFSIIDSLIKLIFGLPLIKILGYLPLAFVIAAIFAIRIRMFPFFILLICILFSSLLYETIFLLAIYASSGRFYFNVRHLSWLIPFVAVIYGYGLSLNRYRPRYIGALFSMFFIWMSLWNIYASYGLMASRSNPSYRAAAEYIAKEAKESDYIGWPAEWVPGCLATNPWGKIPINSLKLGRFNLEEFRNNNTLQRAWIVVADEDCLGIPHFDNATSDALLDSLKHNLRLQLVWQEHKIKIYIFTKNKIKNFNA